MVLVGDACHAFPPDIGQGINAGLCDVLALDNALSGIDIIRQVPLARSPTTLGAALEKYQANRRPEHRALIRLARFGSPYQYRQSWKRHRMGRNLWTLNVAGRMLLSKISGGILPKPAILLASDPTLTFRQVMRQADAATLGYTMALALAMVTILRKMIIGG